MPPPTRLALVDSLAFVSFNGKVFAVDRSSGAIRWRWEASKGGGSSVTILPDGDRLFASCQGYTWALDPSTGQELWYQPFEGEGTGIPMLATMRGTGNASAAAAVQASQQAAAAAAAAAMIAASTAATTAAT